MLTSVTGCRKSPRRTSVPGAADHQAAVLKSDQGDEQADACGNPAFQRLRNGVHDLGANARQGNRHKENPRQQYRRQRLLPGQTKPQRRHAAERVNEEEVLAHARRKGHRIVGDQAHEQRGKRPGQAGGRQDGAEIHSGLRKHSRLDEDDVRHRQESGDAANHLALEGGAVGFKLEEANDELFHDSTCIGKHAELRICWARMSLTEESGTGGESPATLDVLRH